MFKFRNLDQTPGNRLVECQDCHSLYHQECHKPAVTQKDVTDPRLVWYCAKCTRTIKKRVSFLFCNFSNNFNVAYFSTRILL